MIYLQYLCFFVLSVHAATAQAPSRTASSLGPVQDLVPNFKFTNKCIVEANEDGSDDAPAILKAFKNCGRNGNVVFQNTTYHINSMLNTTDLNNCKIDLHGTLLWSNDTDYWLENSQPTGYQNQTSVWFLGGKHINLQGHGYGTFDGNGQVWWDLVKGQSNYPNRPMALTIWNAQDSLFEGLRFVQPQMWTVTIMHSKRVLMQDIYINSTSSNKNPARNSDGLNTLFSDRITLRRWTVKNGDDCIAMKANSTNILVEDSVFYSGIGFAIGSIGQYAGQFETIENVTVRNLVCHGTRHGAFIKTWTGEQNGYPPNGGGAGLGFMKNLSWDNVTVIGGREMPIQIGQCSTFNGVRGNCSSSLFEISDISMANFRGTIKTSRVAQLRCSKASGGCDRIRIENIDFQNIAVDPPTAATEFACQNVNSPIGFKC